MVMLTLLTSNSERYWKVIVAPSKVFVTLVRTLIDNCLLYSCDYYNKNILNNLHKSDLKVIVTLIRTIVLGLTSVLEMILIGLGAKDPLALSSLDPVLIILQAKVKSFYHKTIITFSRCSSYLLLLQQGVTR